jgi:hypothetical protein
MSPFKVSSTPVVERHDVEPIDIVHACLMDVELANNLFARWSKTFVTSRTEDIKVTRVEHADELVHPMWVQQRTIGLALSRSSEEWNQDVAERLDVSMRQFFLAILNSRPSPSDGIVFLGALRTDIKLLSPEYAKFTWKQTYTVGHSEEEARRRASGASAAEA